MHGRARQDLTEARTERRDAGAGQLPADVDRRGAAAVGQRVGRCRVAGVHHPGGIAAGRRERLAVTVGEPHHVVGALAGRRQHRPRRRDPVGTADPPRGGHRRERLQEQPEPEDGGERDAADLSEPERRPLQTAERRGEPVAEHERRADGRHGGVHRRVRRPRPVGTRRPRARRARARPRRRSRSARPAPARSPRASARPSSAPSGSTSAGVQSPGACPSETRSSFHGFSWPIPDHKPCAPLAGDRRDEREHEHGGARRARRPTSTRPAHTPRREQQAGDDATARRRAPSPARTRRPPRSSPPGRPRTARVRRTARRARTRTPPVRRARASPP